MAFFLPLKGIEGQTWWINPEHIRCMREEGAYTVVVLGESEELHIAVTDTPNKIIVLSADD